MADTKLYYDKKKFMAILCDILHYNSNFERELSPF